MTDLGRPRNLIGHHSVHILPKTQDNAELMVDAIRKATGLPPKYAKHDGEGVEAHPFS